MSELSAFVVTPTGVVMHAENHRKLVEHLRASKSRLVDLLEPAMPFVGFATDDDLMEIGRL